MTKVLSSTIKEIDYTDKLRVKFMNDSVYEYEDVPKELYESFLNAESKGKFFGANIRGKFATTKV